MKRIALGVCGLGLVATLVSAQEVGSPTTQPVDGGVNEISLESLVDRVSYTLGAQFGQKINRSSFEINKELVLLAVKDVIYGGDLRITAQEMRAAMNQMRQELAQRNLESGRVFLSKNREKVGVITLESGLQYKVIEPGDGEMPKLTDRVRVHYSAMLIDGQEFDSSYRRGRSAVFFVGEVVPGWTEALQLMKVNAHWQLFIPSNLAYGEKGNPRISPNSALVFDVKLLAIEPPQADGG